MGGIKLVPNLTWSKMEEGGGKRGYEFISVVTAKITSLMDMIHNFSNLLLLPFFKGIGLS